MAQKQVRRREEQEKTPPPAPVKAPQAQGQKETEAGDEELDRLLAEVDERLEENPEAFLEGYTQRGGE